MAKIVLDESIKYTEEFTDWVCRKIRHTKGESQAKLARYLGMSQQSLSDRITEKVPWSLRDFYLVQAYFGKKFGEEEEKKDEDHR